MTAQKKTPAPSSPSSSDVRPAPVISVIGTGYLGATHAAAMAEMGFETIGVDVDPAKLAALTAGEVPFFEPGLPELITKHVASGKLRFTASLPEAVAAADVHFVCVGTPQKAGSHAANLSYVEAATRGVAEHLTHPGLIVGKSTVPVGTAARLRELVREFTPPASTRSSSGTPSSSARARPSRTPCTRTASSGAVPRPRPTRSSARSTPHRSPRAARSSPRTSPRRSSSR
ncbi:hypothetical protein JOE58_000643 [Curtobacterium luteum]|uniref:UDP-glucose/GDP-mannose dehydrogenase N-terminal domain-containing protein n=1 Tax=Curtobacterium luteum TaxID=33881 RepID=A0A8H9G7P4_9MICO|nr:hypothetical protein [Curtobacterium luteum]GGK90774.1 hypothetical protein GCM10009769_06150 [Curtobacterium luteum]